MPEFKENRKCATVNSCCCFSLRTGGYILGVLDILACILSVYFAANELTPDEKSLKPELTWADKILDVLSIVLHSKPTMRH